MLHIVIRTKPTLVVARRLHLQVAQVRQPVVILAPGQVGHDAADAGGADPGADPGTRPCPAAGPGYAGPAGPGDGGPAGLDDLAAVVDGADLGCDSIDIYSPRICP